MYISSVGLICRLDMFNGVESAGIGLVYRLGMVVGVVLLSVYRCMIVVCRGYEL